MKKCSDCNTLMIENGVIHTNYVGGVSLQEQIYVDYEDEVNGVESLLDGKKYSKKNVKARICPNCGKVELYVDINK